ncbi:MAG: spermidine/putrescine ABC transporter ATP-binding protein [Verrucomicrobia bacterium]|nr:MAG: spermidine/putrescine ABC transporter ATP-binding protein [Verrucomicrobiota bacterium]
MRITINNLTKKFGQTFALKDVTLDIVSQELFFLLGPSGCGKTTLLRVIAGFYEPDEGDLLFGGRSMRSVPPHRRNTGLVFQNYALWPHMTVAQNVAYGLEVRAVDLEERKRRVAETLTIVQMDPYAHRTPNQLSGGQQQRVALARALVIKPDVLLLDEPLSNLDAKLRLEMREEIRRIHAQTRITTVYVTHDQKEALSLADRIAVMRDGRIVQIGDPRSIYRAPVNRFVADFIGETNWLAAEVRSSSANGLVLTTAAGTFRASPQPGRHSGEKVWLGFRPEAVKIGANEVNSFQTTIRHVSYLGEIEQYSLASESGTTIIALEPNPLEIRRVGSPLTVHLRPEDALVLPQNALG